MNIKVGDLGLATKLEAADEKRTTICGTPNYIAPEVIQGDRTTRGHSFEVDIWSMGVIVYTCLCGKPPYEAKDVKATYQRIIANEYSFPRDIQISDYAKDIIRSMLQSKPADRPKLEDIAVHPFFTQQFIPQSLPSTVTSVAPVWDQNELGELVPTSTKTVAKSDPLSKPGLPLSSVQRRPLVSRDINVDQQLTTKSSKTPRDGPEPVKTTLLGLSSATGQVSGQQTPSTSTQPAFRVYDENETENRHSGRNLNSGRKSVQSFQVSKAEEEIVTRTAAMSIRVQDASPLQAPSFNPTPRAVLPSPAVETTATAPQSGLEQDMYILHNMIERIETVLDVSSRRSYSHVHPDSPSLTAFSRGGPSRWVSRYVDYTSKYGLGFLLNDGRYVIKACLMIRVVYFPLYSPSLRVVLEFISMTRRRQYWKQRGRTSNTSSARSRQQTPLVVVIRSLFLTR